MKRYRNIILRITGKNKSFNQALIIKRNASPFISYSDQIAILDLPIPDKPIGSLLFDEATTALIDNPDYTEPATRDLAAEIDELKASSVENLSAHTALAAAGMPPDFANLSDVQKVFIMVYGI